MKSMFFLEEEKRKEELCDISSPYYAGSACLYSLAMNLFYLEDRIDDFDKLFPSLLRNTESLYQEDPILFAYTKLPSLTEEEGSKAISFLKDYYSFFVQCGDLIRYLKERNEKLSLPYLERDYLFLKGVSIDNINAFKNKKDIPSNLKEEIESLSHLLVEDVSYA